jgi:hypothetical protein
VCHSSNFQLSYVVVGSDGNRLCKPDEDEAGSGEMTLKSPPCTETIFGCCSDGITARLTLQQIDDGCPESQAEIMSSTSHVPPTDSADDQRNSILAGLDPSSFETEEFFAPFNESGPANSDARHDGVGDDSDSNSTAVVEMATGLQSMTSSSLESNESVSVVTELPLQNFSDGVTVASQWNTQQGYRIFQLN